MPRHGVGLNDLLGGKEAGEGEAIANLPKTEAQMLGRAPENFSRTLPKRPHLERQTDRKPITVSEAEQLNACDV